MFRKLVSVVLLCSLVAAAQAPPMADFTPPPLIPVPPPLPADSPDGAPPPPGWLPTQRPPQKPEGPEVGLMVSESLFGMLSAAGTTVLPYFLLGLGNGGMDRDLMGVFTVALFGLTPVVVAQTQTGIANGSPYYRTDAWVPLLTGLVVEGAVLTTYFFANRMHFAPPSAGSSAGGAPPDQGPVVWLFIGSLAVTPLLQMVAINLFKQPKAGVLSKLGAPPDKYGFSVGFPLPAPVLAWAQGTTAVGAQLQFFRGTW